ncbi:hypothetical protein Barb6_02000 [Bacteroidales bacterium Barb6]|nr:hypothetical protein Barb6_02000 [Bacteroidales bacterium Barb6]
MNEYEEMAEKVMMCAYWNGNIIERSNVISLLEERSEHVLCKISAVRTVLSEYGEITKTPTIHFLYYSLNSKGLEFAKNGCFSGLEKMRVEAEKARKRAFWNSFFRDVALVIISTIIGALMHAL